MTSALKAMFRPLLGIALLFGLNSCRSTDPPPPIKPEPKKPDTSKIVRTKIERYRALAKNLTPVEKTQAVTVFEIEGEYYAQQIRAGEISMEAFGKSWKYDNGEIVLVGKPCALSEKIVIQTDNDRAEFCLFQNGKYRVSGNPNRGEYGRQRITIPIKDN